MAGYFYAFSSEAAAESAGALPLPVSAIVLREDGIAVVAAVVDAESGELLTPAVMSAQLVILSPTMIPGCSGALIVPPGHAGFA